MGKRGKHLSKAKRPGSGWKNWVYFGVSAVVVITMGLGAVLFTGGGGSTSPSGTPSGSQGTATLWNEIRRAPPLVQEAYAYAAEHPETTGYIPCYCGCGQHDGHRSIQDCFVAARNPDGRVADYDPHGLGCDMCVDIVAMTKRMLAEGKPLSEVRKAVTAKYSYLGPPTNTPPIP